jgi:hypothetical protein
VKNLRRESLTAIARLLGGTEGSSKGLPTRYASESGRASGAVVLVLVGRKQLQIHTRLD